MIVHETRPNRFRPGATQATLNACVAASVADALADIAGWRDASARTAQLRLISELGGLRHAGTSLELARDASRRLFSRIATFDVVGLRVDDAVKAASLGYGVVVGLTQPAVAQGHAYRVLAGDFPDLQDFSTAPRYIKDIVAPLDAFDNWLEVHLFDPWPRAQRLPSVSYGWFRRQYDWAGSKALLIAPRGGPSR